MTTPRRLALAISIIVHVALFPIGILICVNWSAWIKPLSTWELVLWGTVLGIFTTIGEWSAMYAWTGKWSLMWQPDEPSASGDRTSGTPVDAPENAPVAAPPPPKCE